MEYKIIQILFIIQIKIPIKIIISGEKFKVLFITFKISHTPIKLNRVMYKIKWLINIKFDFYIIFE